jgi:3-methyladenine DNA glycosylase AlkD
MVKKFHGELLARIKANAGTKTKQTDLDSYLGTTHMRYAINIPTLRQLIKEWAKQHEDISSTLLVDLITSLMEAPSSTEKITGALLLSYLPRQRGEMDPRILDKWLEHLEGWSEIDALCQGHFFPKEMKEKWPAWEKLIIQFSKSKDIRKRRASLVLLVTTALQSGDEIFSELSLKVVDRLKEEKDILISKAVSWLLRSMAKHQRKALEEYLSVHKDSLPKNVQREVMIKLTTGKKNGNVNKKK